MPPKKDSRVDFFDMPETPYRASRLMKALGNPKAYALVKLLLETDVLPVQAIADALGRSLWDTSKILRVLRDLDVVRYQRSGTSVRYTLKDGKAARDLVDSVERFVDRARGGA